MSQISPDIQFQPGDSDKVRLEKLRRLAQQLERLSRVVQQITTDIEIVGGAGIDVTVEDV